jgi:hypothetical protein
MPSSLPEGFRVRPATTEDAPAINELVIAVDTAVQGWSDSTEAELVGWWRLTDLTGNSWVVEDDSLAAYAVVIPHGESAETDAYRRGQPRVRLGVDAQNPTGATRLYERAGMHVAYEAAAFKKELT